MFGYVTVNPQQLTPEQSARYRGCYCGLCRALREEYGQAARLGLTYDMLSSLYEPDEQSGGERCLLHPAKPHAWWTDVFTSYAAGLNTALAYYNCLDDWQDDRSLVRLSEAKLLLPAVRKAEAAWPKPCAAIVSSLRELSRVEREAPDNPDAGANAFGNLMGALFVWQEDRWAEILRGFGFCLGKYIYFLDAACDLAEDRRRGRYNPLLAMAPEAVSGQAFREHLTLLIGDAACEFEKLPLVQDLEILRNILYSGVWAKYCYTFRREAEEEHP